MTELPLVSIIIVNYCGKNYLEKCLSSLFETNYNNYEIIFVDNNSNDGSIDFVNQNFPKIKVVKLNKNYGFAVPNNTAARMANGKYLVFLNNDTYVTKNWLIELIKVMESDKTIALAQSLILYPDGSVDSSGDYVDLLGRAYSLHDKPTKIRHILSPKGACMIARKDTFLDLGGFDETFFASFEDVDLGWRSWLWGFKVIVIPSSVIYHLGAKTIKQIPKTIAFHGIKNNIQIRLTNFDFIDSFRSIILMMIIVFSVKLFGIEIFKIEEKSNMPDTKTQLKALIWIMRNFTQVLKKRRKTRARQIRNNSDLKKMGLITKKTSN